MEATANLVRSQSRRKAIRPSSQEGRQEALSFAIRGQSCGNLTAIFRGFAEKGIPESETRLRDIDGLCMTQACRGVLLDLRCALEAWAEHYGVPDEALRAMLADAFLFERTGMTPLSPDFFAELANDILAEQAESNPAGGVQ